MNDVIKTIISRRSVRRFEPGPIEEEKLSAILEAGRYAPSGGNCQFSHLFVMRDPVLREQLRVLVPQELAKFIVDESTYKSIRSSVASARKGTLLFDYYAPVLITVANRISHPNALVDSACVIENMALAAHSMGIGACYINQLHWLDENSALRDLLRPLGLSDEETICGSLALGYPHESMKGLQPLPRTGNPVVYL